MTIAEEISALQDRIDVAYDHIAAKGGTVPAETDSWHLSTAIDSIPAGGGAQEAVDGVSSLYSVFAETMWGYDAGYERWQLSGT